MAKTFRPASTHRTLLFRTRQGQQAIVLERDRIAREGATAALWADRSLTEQLPGVGMH